MITVTKHCHNGAHNNKETKPKLNMIILAAHKSFPTSSDQIYSLFFKVCNLVKFHLIMQPRHHSISDHSSCDSCNIICIQQVASYKAR